MPDKEIQYDSIAHTYACYRDASTAVIRHILRCLKNTMPDKVLEIGCGTADHLNALCAAMGAEGHGFDLSAGMIAEGNQKNSGLHLQTGDAAVQYPFPDQFFDFAFSINVIHYISDLNTFFSEALRVLKPGGTLVTLTDSEQDIHDRAISRYFPETVPNELQRYPSIDSIQLAMQQAGFADIHTTHMQRGYFLTADHLEKFRNKAYSALRLIPEDAFQRGVERAEVEIAAKTARGQEVYTCIWGARSWQ
jgi:SAM-dependent methyltransferase